MKQLVAESEGCFKSASLKAFAEVGEQLHIQFIGQCRRQTLTI